MGRFLGSASSAAIILGLSSMAAWAQTPDQPPVDTVADQPSQENDQPTDRVVVTGSFISGTPEDAALPVEVFSQVDLEKQGSPRALEFAKNLSIGGPVLGESNFFGGSQNTGSTSLNLRSLGTGKTLTLLNGRRTSTNTANIPSIALERMEILKDGGAVIYGADATGGVVNFITRDSFEGVQAEARYKYVDGSDGDYGLALLGGTGKGDASFIWSVEWDHRSRLSTRDRDFSSLPYYINPAASASTDVMAWRALGARPAYPGANGQSGNSFQGEFGLPVGATQWADFTTASCNAIEGIVINANTCGFQVAPFYNLVEKQDTYRAFAQFKSAVNDDMNFHIDGTYGQVKVPENSAAGSRGVLQGPARLTGQTSQFYVPRANPYFLEFAQRSGLAATPTFSQVQGLTSNVAWRPFIHAGSRYMGETPGTPTKVDNQMWRVSTGIDGRLGESFGVLKDVNYDLGVTYNQAISYFENPDIVSYRLEEALAGFGGPNCRAADLNPYQFGTQNDAAAGQNGCLWFNPFASSFPNNPATGASNPSYKSGSENSAELVRWLFDSRSTETVASNLTVDLVFNSETGITLPGGNIGVAVGGQLRQLEQREQTLSDWANGTNKCVWPSQFTTGVVVNGVAQLVNDAPRSSTDPLFTGCTPDGPGGTLFFTNLPPAYFDRQQQSAFAEFKIPVLDNVNLQAAVRREEFSGGLGATVYKVSGKWDVWGPLALRGSYGTNYQAPPIDLRPGEVRNAVAGYTVVNGNFRNSQSVTAANVSPETAKAWNLGAIWKSSGFADDHDLTVIIDYFDIKTEGEIGPLATTNQIANAIFTGPRNASNFPTVPDCNHPLIGRVTFSDTTTAPGGRCVAGVSSAEDIAGITTVTGNGPGQSTAGVDFQVTYELPLGPGDLTLSTNGTMLTRLKTGPTLLDGYQVTAGDDRLGFLNVATIAAASPEWRVNAAANYNFGQHNVRLGANFVSGVIDERGATTPAGGLGSTNYGVDGDDWLVFSLTYLFDLTDATRFTATVNNILDKDPPGSRYQFGYDPSMGDPLGRTIEVGIRHVF